MDSNHRELEAVWREKWMQAKLNLELARLHFHQIQRVANIPEEDYQRSLQALTVAVNEHSRVLQIYTDLTLHGKIPQGAHPH